PEPDGADRSAMEAQRPGEAAGRRSITGAAVQSLEGAAVEISLDLAPATGPERSVTETGVVELGATGRPEPSARAGALAAEDPLERRAVQPPHEPHAAELRGVGVRAVAAVHGATGGGTPRPPGARPRRPPRLLPHPSPP